MAFTRRETMDGCRSYAFDNDLRVCKGGLSNTEQWNTNERLICYQVYETLLHVPTENKIE
jgi:hypothetical protein